MNERTPEEKKLAEFLEKENLVLQVVALAPKTGEPVSIINFTDWPIKVLVKPASES